MSGQREQPKQQSLRMIVVARCLNWKMNKKQRNPLVSLNNQKCTIIKWLYMQTKQKRCSLSQILQMQLRDLLQKQSLSLSTTSSSRVVNISSVMWKRLLDVNLFWVAWRTMRDPQTDAAGLHSQNAELSCDREQMY